MKLTEKQKEMYERLKREGNINWAYTTPAETRLLNGLVSKGFAERVLTDGGVKYWIPVEKY